MFYDHKGVLRGVAKSRALARWTPLSVENLRRSNQRTGVFAEAAPRADASVVVAQEILGLPAAVR